MPPADLTVLPPVEAQEIPVDLVEKFKTVSSLPADDQAKKFLRAFVLEFRGRFEEILDMTAQFTSFSENSKNPTQVVDLNEFDAHRFLEKRDESMTVAELRRKVMGEMDLDKNRRLSLIEYLLWKYQKPVALLFAKPPMTVSEDYLAEFEAAMAEYQKVVEQKRARENQMRALEAQAEGGGVKALAAKNQLAQMKSEDQLAQNKREIDAELRRKKAEKAYKEEDPFKKEQERLEAEKRAKEEEEKRKRDEGRKRLAEKAKTWNSPDKVSPAQ
ncbi:hypothetical protein M427DRAFT_67912 [Gonapodya prolifera JEL478]|uniref:Calcium-regulated actin-bundling protein C-terminal domain-containing protein n=1 Tax=Gonapodya prolifera (strain JEL478) TaxID=1344416 RepID=A0A139AMV2_GONPJ|nr:hypothetical protein M427DRAFT_67912 [Gonapodya prolifera JEL478]|eukprot:KXS18079.1 hypothetical protein M427DRAFT_67912 [Gonapodya prolifera JEL478]